MFQLVKNLVDGEKKVQVVVKVLKDGTCLLFREKTFIRKYKDLEKCLDENKFYEFLKEKVTYDEYRN